MADAILGHRRTDGKSTPIALHNTSIASMLLASTNLTEAAFVNCLVFRHSGVPHVQAMILATVNEPDSATLEDIVVALAGHPKPPNADFAMVIASILGFENGILDANSRLSHALPSTEDGNDGETPNDSTKPAGGGDNTGSGSGGADIPTAGMLREITGMSYSPAVYCVSGLGRSDLRTEPLLGRPGVYAAFWGSEVYVGASKNLVARLTKGPHLVTPRPADRIVAIVDRTGQLGWGGAQVAERLLYRQLIASGELKPRNEEPNGGHVDEVEYEQVHDLVEAAMQALRREGLVSPAKPVAKPPAAPRTAPPEQALFATRIERRPCQPGIYRLDACGVAARARVDESSWTLLAGSVIRSDVMPSAHPSAKQRRMELLHSGGLVRKGRDYLLTQDLSFGSATGAAHFVVGSKTRADIWSAVDAPYLPTRQI